ncbi:low temperature requirement protein A [Microbacterium sp. K24]|uniref:low temperature requirement protein A n=1 Tax=Microbacterium sp. K24 TaxID=2305446 RepID=UPI001F10DC4A|nr:low temperature requirement protein A [Microbacterium sp. K24]
MSASDPAELPDSVRTRLRDELHHRLRPMSGNDPHDRSRRSTPLELLYDLVYVIAFGRAAEELAHQLAQGDPGPAFGAFLFVIFAISWAWMNFTWFASAYGNDDALFRVATIVQMVGAVLLTFGLPVAFETAQHGESPNNALLVAGYLVMRVPLIALWLRAARGDAARRSTARAYALTIAVAQLGWVLTVVVPIPTPVTIVLLVLLAFAEMTAPVIIERRLGRAPWNPGHLGERFSLLTIIVIGEVVWATTTAVGALVEEHGWSASAVIIAAFGLLLAASIWWAYFLVPSTTVLELEPARVFAWRYAHLPMFGAIAAIGAGLRVAAEGVGEGHLSLTLIALSLAIPVSVVLLSIFATWSLLVRSYDFSHVPLLAASLTPMIAAVVFALSVDGGGEVEAADSVTALTIIVSLVALSFVVEVIGHERVGFRHTVRALARGSARFARS